MKSSEFKVVRTARTLAEADLLIGLLRSAKLHPTDPDTSSHFTVAGVDISYPVQVPAEEAERAAEVLESFERSVGGQ